MDITPHAQEKMVAPHSPGRSVVSSDLRTLSLFKSLGDQDLLDIANRLTFNGYTKDEEIFGQFEEDDGVYFILSGFVRITVYSAAGKEVTFRDLGPGDMFGELAAIDGQPRSANACAKSNARVGRVSTSQFWALLEDFPAVNAAILTYLCGLVRDLSARVYQFSAHAVGNRIQAEILRLARLAGPGGNTATISPAPTHAEIASRVNTHREAVTREISKLARAGLLERSAGKLIVADIEALANLAEEIAD